MTRAVHIASLILLLSVATVEATEVWTDGNGDGLADTTIVFPDPWETVTVDLWIDSGDFAWTAFQIWIDGFHALTFDSAGYSITGGDLSPIDTFSSSGSVGLAGFGYDYQGITQIGWISARVDSADTSCFRPRIDPDDPSELFCIVFNPDTFMVFEASHNTCYYIPRGQRVALFEDGFESVAGPDNLIPCSAAPPTRLKPSIQACGFLPFKSSVDTIVYYCGNPTPVPNLPCTLEVRTATKTGYHFHNSPERPLLFPVFTGNTGPQGLSFRVPHTWPEDAREVRTVFYAPLPGCADHDTAFNWCVRESVYTKMLPGEFYQLVGGVDNITRHPEHHYGRPALIDSLKKAAATFIQIKVFPEPTHISINDMSLPWGGLFDVDDDENWDLPHCAHRDGRDANISIQEFEVMDRVTVYDALLFHHLQPRFGQCFVLPDNQCTTIPSGSVIDTLVYLEATMPRPAGGQQKVDFRAIANLESGVPAVAAAMGTLPPASPIAGERVMTSTATAVVGSKAQQTPLNVSVSVTVTPNSPSSGFYTYSYSVTNDTTSQDTLEIFALSPVHVAVSASSPNHWRTFHGFAGDAKAQAWTIKDLGNPPAGWIDHGGFYVSEFAPRPGQSVSGFKLVTRIPPDTLNWYATDRELPGNYNPPPNFLWQDAVTGRILGPGPNITGVEGGESDSRGGSQSFMGPPIPNPGPGKVTLSFNLSEASLVNLLVYDVSGRLVREVESGLRAKGIHHAVWAGVDRSGKPVPSGIYFFRLEVEGREAGFQRVAILR